jgi:amino acid adenylation domain-containing protein
VDGVPGTLQSWGALLRERAESQPEAVAFEFASDRAAADAESRLTYRELDLRSRAFAARITARRPRTPVLLMYPQGLDFVVAVMACLRSGVVAAPVSPPTARAESLERLLGIVTDSGAELALTGAVGRERIMHRAGRMGIQLPAGLKIADTPGWAEGSPDARADAKLESGRTALLQYTSGSTAAPRGVRLTHANLLHNSAIIARAFGTSKRTRGVSWLPLYHDMGLIGAVLQTVHCGGSCLLMSPASFVRDPLSWLRAISRTGATVSGGPNFAYDLCVEQARKEAITDLDLSAWEVAFNGAEPVRAETLERFASAFAGKGFSRDALTPCYGLAEASLMVTCKPRGRRPTIVPSPDPSSSRPGGRDGITVVGVGEPPAGDAVIIVDPATRKACSDGAVGEIWLSGPSIGGGYWSADAEEQLRFSAPLAERPGQRFLRTGDLGFMRDGELFVTGRLKDLVIIRGRNHYPQDIEQTAERSHPSMLANSSAAFSVVADQAELLVTVHELDRHVTASVMAEIAGAIRAEMAECHGISIHEVIFLSRGMLPRTTSGKVRRATCRELWLAKNLVTLAVYGASSVLGHLPEAESPGEGHSGAGQEERADAAPVARPAAAGHVAAVRGHVAAVLGIAATAVPEDRPLLALGIDSLAGLQLQHRLQTAAGLCLPSTDVLSLTVADLAAMIAANDLPPAEAAARLPAPDPEAPFRVSGAQETFWFLSQLAPTAAANLIAGAARLHTDVDPERLYRSLCIVVARHEALRTTFPAGSEPVQRVHRVLEPEFRVIRSALAAHASLGQLMEQAAWAPMDPEQGPLVRMCLFTDESGTRYLTLTLHHLVADFWSLGLLVEELGNSLSAAKAMPSLAVPVSYRRCAAHKLEQLSGERGRQLWQFWQHQLAMAPSSTDLPHRAIGASRSRFRGAGIPFTLSAELNRRLREVAEAAGTTIFSVLLTAYQMLLYRYSGQRDLVIGTPWHGRDDPESAAAVGCFMNLVPLRTVVDPAEPYREMLCRVHRETREALLHGDLPFALLVERLRPPREPGRPPLVNVVFSFYSAPGTAGQALVPFALGRPGGQLQAGDLRVTSVSLTSDATQFDLVLTMGELADGTVAGELRYDADLMDEALGRQMAAHLQQLYWQLVNDPAAPVGAIPMAAGREREEPEREPRPAPPPWQSAALLHQRIADQARQRPDAIALQAGDEHSGSSLTYAGLRSRAVSLAQRLRALGVVSGSIVAVVLPRTAELVVSLLAVLEAGAAFLPIDPELPAPRIAAMIADAQPAALVTADSVRHRLPDKCPHVIAVPCDDIQNPPVVHAAATPSAAHPAYVIYTSGSTGQPKGVVISHAALAAFVSAVTGPLDISAASRWLGVTTVSFDIAVLELLVPLCSGGYVRLAGRGDAADGRRLLMMLDSDGITHMQATPGTWQLLADAGWRGTPGLHVLCGGDKLPVRLARELASHMTRAWNLYGPTEATIWSTVARITAADGPAPIGLPLANTRAYVLDAALAPVPLSVVGELFLGGASLADGYLHQPAQTADRFLPDPFHGAGQRMYRTGDLVRRDAGGELHFVGRTDTQVKVRGYRVELGEIEAVLETHPVVRRAVAIVRHDGMAATLMAYLEPAGPGNAGPDERQLTAESVRALVRQQLPGYMVPARLEWVASLPVTANGKVDRGRLPAPAPDPSPGPGGLPRSQTEETVAGLVAALLERPAVGCEDNLFDLGAHSLTLSRLVLAIRAASGAEIELQQAFDCPTVAAIATLVDAAPRRFPTEAIQPANRQHYRARQPAEGKPLLPAAMRDRTTAQ